MLSADDDDTQKIEISNGMDKWIKKRFFNGSAALCKGLNINLKQAA